MTIRDYIDKIGFVENPFQYTNADQETLLLDRYFISPTYFEDLWGDPTNPTSNIVFGPRGCGKTALRLMIEKRAKEDQTILAITYTDHDLSEFKCVDEIDQSYHLKYLNRILLIAFFNRIYTSELEYTSTFNFVERQYLYRLCKAYLFNTPRSFPSHAIRSLKTIEDHLVDIWKKFKSPISDVIGAISRSKGVDVDISKISIDDDLASSHKENFLNLKDFLTKVGITSIYILVDKVDEQKLTGNDPIASYKFVSSLIKDLSLIETPGIAFKFFLWDELKPYCAKDARPDRIFSYSLTWDFETLYDMMEQRIRAHGRNLSMSSKHLFVDYKSLGRIILFSEFSPRDVIRICNTVISEQIRLKSEPRKISGRVVNMAIDKFCRERAIELVSFLNLEVSILLKFDSVSFTESYLSGRMGLEKEYLLEILRSLKQSRFIRVINGYMSDQNREYAFTDVRLARVACNFLSLDDFVQMKVKDCHEIRCRTFNYRDFDKKTHHCQNCNSVLNAPEFDLMRIGGRDTPTSFDEEIE